MADSEKEPEEKIMKNVYELFDNKDRRHIFIIIAYLVSLMLICTICLFPRVSMWLTGLLFSQDSVGVNALHYYFFNVCCAGVLGSAMFGLRKLYAKLTNPIGKNNLELSDAFRIRLWFSTFYYKPWMGGALAIMTLSMLNAGFISLSDSSTSQAVATNTQALYFQISFGFLVGFGSNEVIKKVDQIISLTFQSTKDKGISS